MIDLPILIILLLILAMLFRVDFIFYIVYMTIGIGLWSRWYTPRALRQLRFTRIFNSHAFLGEKISIKIVVNNESRLPVPWLQLSESIATELRGGSQMKQAFTLGGRAGKSFTYEIRAMRRGYYLLGPGQVTSGDLFGFKENRSQLPANYLTVYPRIIPISRQSSQAKLPFGTIRSQQRLFQDPSRPLGVRDYQPGDSLRHINWKASAHADELLVKTYRPVVSLDTMILLNLNVDEYSRKNKIDGPEWAISLAASYAAFLAEKRQAVGMATNGFDPLLKFSDLDHDPTLFDEASGRLGLNVLANDNESENDELYRKIPIPTPIQPGPGRHHLMTILETLARLETTQTEMFSAWATGAVSNLSWGITILVISPSGDLQTCRSLHNLVRRGFNPILVIIEPYTDFMRIQRRARPFGFPVIRISSNKELQRWSRASDRHQSDSSLGNKI